MTGKKRVIGGASGFIGRALTKRWLAQGIEVIAIGRDREHLKTVFQNQVQPITWDELAATDASFFGDCELILNLAGASLAKGRWKEATKKALLDSRIETTSQLAHFCQQLGDNSPPFFCASAVSYYGLQQPTSPELPKAFDEDSVSDEDGSFLQQIARQWEQATFPAREAGARVVNLRFGVVLSNEGGALKMMDKPFRFCLGGPVGNGYQPFPWITLNDALVAIEFLLEKPDAAGPFNIVAPGAISQGQFAKALGKALGRPAVVPMPAKVINTLLKEMGQEVLLSGQHVEPKRLQELGFEFATPDIVSALNSIYM